MKNLTIFTVIGASLLFGAAGQAAANDLMVASLFDGNRQALEHNCAEAKARFALGGAEIATQCSVENR